MFGPHLMLDCYGCSESRLKDFKFVLNFLDKLPGMIDMHKIADPYAIDYPGRPDSFDKGGISAMVLIAESHIAIHTFPAQNYMSVDIFSCKNFDIERAIEYVAKAFQAKKLEKKILNRGIEFPKEVPKAIKIVRKQREKIKL